MIPLLNPRLVLRAACRWIARGMGPSPTPWRLLAACRDRIDERRARRRRAALGRKGCLVSWARDPDGGWRARLSGPWSARTMERTAATRTEAIDRSTRAMDRLPELRGRLGPRPGPPADPGRFLGH